MIEFKGTKGEWSIDPKISTVIRNCEGRGVANVSVYTSNSGTLDIDAENDANAKLIATAPELLDALKEMVKEFEHDRQTARETKAINFAKSAITKALTI